MVARKREGERKKGRKGGRKGGRKEKTPALFLGLKDWKARGELYALM